MRVEQDGRTIRVTVRDDRLEHPIVHYFPTLERFEEAVARMSSEAAAFRRALKRYKRSE